jgi:hypothetical protein
MTIKHTKQLPQPANKIHRTRPSTRAGRPDRVSRTEHVSPGHDRDRRRG